MAQENKTRPETASVPDFMARVEPDWRRQDAQAIVSLLEAVSGEAACLWGPSILGFGQMTYRTPAGREGVMPRIAFSPRKPKTVFYVGADAPQIAALLPALGPHETGRECLYIRRLADVDMGVLERICRIRWALNGPVEA